MCAGVGGFTGPYLVGWVKDATGDFTYGLVALASTSFVVAVIALLLPIERRPAQVAVPAEVGAR